MPSASATTLGSDTGEAWILPGKHLQFLIFVLACAAQLATVIITWPLWEIREFPVNMPVGYATSFTIGQWLSVNYQWLIIGSLIWAVFQPKWGTLGHLAIFILACLADQFRQQPQFIFLVTMMILLARKDGLLAARWLLIALWIWAGLHKWLSPEWFGYNASALMDRQSWFDPLSYPYFAYLVAIGEMAVGVIAIFWRRVPAVAAFLMHVGIALFLTPLGITHNYSVIPWNLFVGISAFYILWTTPAAFPTTWRTATFSLSLLIAPILFYWNLLDHGLSFVLYSGMVPYGRITSSAEDPKSDPVNGQVEGWGELAIPFPNERRTLIQYFQQASPVGSKLHLHDPRPTQVDQYFVKSETGLVELSLEDFLNEGAGDYPIAGAPAGQPYDDHQCQFQLALINSELLSRFEGGPIYAVRMSPANFDPKQLKYFRGLKNVEQIQFANCDLTDQDLKALPKLVNLQGLGLSGTKITDEGLKHLRKFPRLNLLEIENTEVTADGLLEIGFDSNGVRIP